MRSTESNRVGLAPRDPTPAPSRYANPFATCWTRPGALAYQFPPGTNAELLVARLSAAGGWGEIVGPHGSGKSTLVAALVPRLAEAGHSVALRCLHDGERRLPRGWLAESLAAPRPLVIIDGYEQLSWLSRRMLLRRCRQALAGLVVTSHRSVGMPLLFRTQTSLALAQQLVSTLTRKNSSLVDAADVAASHACHASNLREVFFQLYDRHEELAQRASEVAQTIGRTTT